MKLTDALSALRPGLHACRVGTLYGWSFSGEIPQQPDGHYRDGLQVDGTEWPRATGAWYGGRTANACIGTYNRLPPSVQLAPGEQFLLHHWAGVAQANGFRQLWPVWHVVRPVAQAQWPYAVATVSADICPVCGWRIGDADWAPDEDTYTGLHSGYFRQIWTQLNWGVPAARPA